MIIELDEYGMAVWRHRENRGLFAQRSYHWCDRVVVIDEGGGGRTVVQDMRYSDFDQSEWVPVTAEEYAKVKNYYKDIYKDES